MAGRHSGETLKQVAEPDRIVEHAAPSHCDACHTPLHEAKIVESRQVFALPPLRFEVTEHQVFAAPLLRQKLPGYLPGECHCAGSVWASSVSSGCPFDPSPHAAASAHGTTDGRFLWPADGGRHRAACEEAQVLHPRWRRSVGRFKQARWHTPTKPDCGSQVS